jgi:DNA-binding NarL/FixJ family response regulator
MGEGCAAARPFRVLVVDGYPLAREGLRAFLATAPGVRVVGEAIGIPDALRLVAERAPDLVLLGYELSCGPRGVELCRLLKAAPDPPRVLVLAGHNHDEAMLPFRLAGADSYLHRRSDRDVIAEAALRTARGMRVWDAPGDAALPARPEEVGLTPRELEVLTLKRHRHTNADIAATLNVSPHTVKHHVSSIKRKLAMAGVRR